MCINTHILVVYDEYFHEFLLPDIFSLYEKICWLSFDGMNIIKGFSADCVINMDPVIFIRAGLSDRLLTDDKWLPIHHCIVKKSIICHIFPLFWTILGSSEIYFKESCI